MIQSGLHGNMQSAAEMIAPATALVASNKSNGPKVDNPGAGPGLPLAGEIPRVQLAICWELRESGATSLVNQAVKTRPVRTISRKGRKRCFRNPQRPYASHLDQEVKIWSEPHGDMRSTRAKFLVG
jgi:hypothetical protein